jgi:hypothetical protein
MGQTIRADISIPLPNTLHEEALVLRNRLLHYRFCHLFSTKPDLGALMDGVEPRSNQIGLPLLSLGEEPASRTEIRDRLLREQSARVLARQETSEGKVVAALCQLMDQIGALPLAVGAVTEQFNSTECSGGRGPVSEKWVGHVLRTKLGLATQKSHGIYVVADAERRKIMALAARYNYSAAPATDSHGVASATKLNPTNHVPTPP